MNKILKRCWGAAQDLYQEQYTSKASALAFTTLLSIVPLISIFIYAIERFTYFSYVDELAKIYVIKNFLPSSSMEIISYINLFSHQAAQMPFISIGFLFITAILLINTIDSYLKMIWKKHARQEHILYYLLYPLAVLLIPTFMALSAVLSSYLYFLLAFFPLLKFLGSIIVPLVVNTLMLAGLYKLTSSTRIKGSHILSGALIGSFLLEVTKFAFAIYIKQFANYAIIYGALGILPVFLMWLYIFWLIILYGALVSRTS